MVDIAGPIHLSSRDLAALTYLLPAVGGALLLRLLSGRLGAMAVFNFAGTFAHELLHLIVGTLTGAKPVAMDLFPRREPGGKVVMGSVTFTNLRWFNALPSCIAPLLALPLVWLVAWLRTHAGWSFAETTKVDFVVWALLSPQFEASWPSTADWKLCCLSWPLFVAGAAAIWYFWIATS